MQENNPQQSPLATDDAIWTIDDVTSYLKVERQSIYALTRSSVQSRSDNPIPYFKLGTVKGIRFKRSAVLDWVNRLAQKQVRS